MPRVGGTVAPGYEPVRDAFAAVLASEPGHAAQLAASVDGSPVVDLWGGPGLDGDSLLGVLSVTKGVAFLAAALLIQSGELDPGREVRSYWPQFAAEGKAGVTVGELLTHRAGAIGTREGFSPAELADDALIAGRVAAHAPYWRPGSAFGYHSLVIGALTGELVRRTTGLTLKEFHDRRVRVPFGVDLHLGPPARDVRRVVDVLPPLAPPPGPPPAADSLLGIASSAHHPAFLPPHLLVNDPVFRAGGQASAGGVASARGLARFYAVANALLTPATRRAVARPHAVGHDLVLGTARAYGLGFLVAWPSPGGGAFGHDGAGGSVGLADPRHGLVFGYTRRRFPSRDAAADGVRLLRAVRGCARARRG
ncbi:serine hydrolase domain-containing protein [Streptomyces avicenniae]|uniref:serine hydrolase domain-containing protein n=1 Tax=Streptomyces avicenniae TaxID=500153 RepID=UPI000699F13B|nr:serine hydrolase domain-containing protein [Streptomyces avicenniae]